MHFHRVRSKCLSVRALSIRRGHLARYVPYSPAAMANRNSMQRQFLIGIAPILCLFAVIGFYAITLFKELGGKIDVILKENYRSVLAGETMKEGLARMDSAVV